MGNYSKFIGAIVGALVSRYVLKWTGLDLAALGVSAEVSALSALAVEAGVAGAGALIAGAFVYLFPANRPREVEPEVEFRGTDL